jgi:hypothetical protein
MNGGRAPVFKRILGEKSMSNKVLQKWFAPVKKFLPEAIWSPIRTVATAVITPFRFSIKTGHWRSSIQTRACSASGSPIPWYTYPAIDFLAQRDFTDRNILEFGGGQSTLWWSARARSVLTIEEDYRWFSSLSTQVGPNVGLHHIPADTKTRDISPVRILLDANPIVKFDVINIDGHLRRELTALAFDHLAPGGVIIIDNAEGYEIYEELRTMNCRRIDFYGFAPGVVLRHCTSLVFMGDCFLLRPDIPIANIELPAAAKTTQ